MKLPVPIFLLASLCLLVTAASMQLYAQQPPLDNFRPYDQEGVNVFEPAKTDTVPYEGLKLRWGVGFTQQFQSLTHSNKAQPRLNDAGVDPNRLATIGTGTNLAAANLNLDAVLADGIRLNLIVYLSARHHPEAWVKGGYLQVDKLEMLNSAFINQLMQHVRIRVGHMEINYGDTHFRRTDNGNAMYNPFVGNYIMDAFTTEVGGEVYYMHPSGFLAMAALTGGEIQGGVTRADDREPSFIGKLGYDNLAEEGLRLRLTGSVYTTGSSANNTLYAGDRAGSRYYLVMENTLASTAANFTSGRISPGLTDNVTSFMINPFVKVGGLEFLGTYETTTGKSAAETEDRTWNQLAGELIYRFLPREQVYVGARYNTVNGPLAGGQEVSIDRVQVGAGWFFTKNILLKGEYVNQQYNDFLPTDIRYGGEFKGIMLEGVIAF